MKKPELVAIICVKLTKDMSNRLRYFSMKERDRTGKFVSVSDLIRDAIQKQYGEQLSAVI